MLKPHLVVAAALITRDDGCLLIARRPPEQTLGGHWEFPGGKLENNESAEECLVRELQEELALAVKVGAYFSQVTHEYAFATIELCAYWAVPLQRHFDLRVHDAARWASIPSLRDLQFAPADVPIIRRLLCLSAPTELAVKNSRTNRDTKCTGPEAAARKQSRLP